jgi:hypothetical protein
MIHEADIAIFESEQALLRELVSASPDIETGGELLGLWSHKGSPTVMLVTGPSRSSSRSVTSFTQPPKVHMEIESFAWHTFGLQVLGIWHSHHKLGLHELSSGDRARTRHYASKHGRKSYAEILGYIDPHTERVGFRPYVYSDASRLNEVGTQLRTLPGISPVRSSLQLAHPPADIVECLSPLFTPHRSSGVGFENGDGYSTESSTHGDGSGRSSSIDKDAADRRAEFMTAIMETLETALGTLPPGFSELLRIDTTDEAVWVTTTEPNRQQYVSVSADFPTTLFLTVRDRGGERCKKFRWDPKRTPVENYSTCLRSMMRSPSLVDKIGEFVGLGPR